MTGPGSLPLSKPQPSASNQFPQDPTVNMSTQQLCDRIKSATSATSTLLKDTKWPREAEVVIQDLLQIINIVPDHPPEIIIAKDTAEQSVRIVEAVHAKVKETSEKYGTKERGFRDSIKYKISSRQPNKCTDILRVCWADIQKASTMFHSSLGSSETIDPISSGSPRGSEMPSRLQSQLNAPLVKSGSDLEPSTPSPGPHPQPNDSTLGSDPATENKASDPNAPQDPSRNQENFGPVRSGLITAARKTFKTVETVSGAIPAVGDFVGVAAKVGLAFVNMIETMDQNEDVSKELAHHTSKLSKYIEHFKKKSDAENGSDLIIYIENLHKELECVQEKVKLWNSTGRLKKAFLSSEHAEELKGYQDKLQTTLEELQLLVSLKTSDLVVELKNTEIRAERRRLLACLGDGSYGARGNSIEDVICLPGTRVEILERIDKWVKDTSDTTERVLWIRGMAGRGKSTIASTVAHTWASKGSCAIFHFRRGQNAFDGQFICALARQFGKGLVPEVKNAILDCVKENEDIAMERLDQQFKTLIVGAFAKLQEHAHPILIIVDALDECVNVADAVRFVRLIDQHSSFLPTNVKFLLTCRPEAPLLTALEPRNWYAEDLDSTSHVSDEDITRFIQNACAQIRDDHNLPEAWPSLTDLKAIVYMSQGLFQWARTALTYIDDGSPDHRLQELLQSSSTWSGLDDLYHQILSKAFNKAQTSSMRKQLLSWVLGTLVVAPFPVSLEAIACLYADHAVFQCQQDIVQFLRKDILADLNSLLHIPISPSEPVRLMHTSIRDLLVARDRCERRQYFIDLMQDHRRLARVSFQLMGRGLKQNICNLPHYLMANSEVQNQVEEHVSKGLRYCCRSWHIHLTAGGTLSEQTVDATSTVLAEFKVLSEERLLEWLEVMSLIGATIEAGLAANQVYQWLLTGPSTMSDGSLVFLWHDIQRFIAAFVEPISFGALHIYASALPQCPMRTRLCACYGSKATTRVILGERQLNWSANIWTSSANSCVLVVAFSLDGSFLASGLKDGSIKLWDTQTGVQLGDPLTGHSDWITSVVFSPDGRILASGSHDKTVRLWNAKTGAPLGNPLTGHRAWVRSVIFSPDGKVLASGSDDKTIRLWDMQTGALLCDPLTGHGDWIVSVVFSPDSKVLASGSHDKTVRLWDAKTGAPLGNPLIGHRAQVRSVIFSPNGKVLASGSEDKTARLWDVQTGSQLGDPLTGHSEWISSVAFSPDGKVLASGSGDKTVQLWDSQTGAPLGDPLTGHSDCIGSVMFSPNGKVLASRSDDKTVQLWNARTGAPLGDPLTGHSDRIRSIVFSPDSKVLASGSVDKTVRLWNAQIKTPLDDLLTGDSDWMSPIPSSPDGKVLASIGRSDDQAVRLWDTRTGAPVGDSLTGHSDWITSVVFSPDGKVLASGSHDKTVRLWDAQTGSPLAGPLTGHDEWISSLVFSLDNKVLASGSGDNTVRLWDVQTGAPLGNPLTDHTSWITSIVFSPDGKVLASGSGDKTVRLWDARTGAPLGDPLTGHTKWIISVTFSLDGKVLASVSDDKTVRLWDMRSRASLGDHLTGDGRRITSVTFSSDSKVLAVVLDDKTVRLCDAQSGAVLRCSFTGHSGEIESADPGSRDCKTLTSWSKLRYWDPLAHRVGDGSRPDLASPPLRIESNWLLWNSECLLWVPPQYKDGYSHPTMSSLGSLAIVFDKVILVFDVSGSLNL